MRPSITTLVLSIEQLGLSRDSITPASETVCVDSPARTELVRYRNKAQASIGELRPVIGEKSDSTGWMRINTKT